MADDFISQLMASGLLGGGNSIQGGLLGQLGNATQPYGGMGNLGLSLLANSGPTPYKRGFGQVFGQSALQSQDTANKNAEQKLQLMTGAMGLQQAMQRQKEYSDYVASMNGQQVPQGQPQGQPPDQSQSPDANLPPQMIRAPGFQGYDPSNPSQPPQQAQPQQAPQQPPQGVSGLATPEQVNAAARYAMSQPNANPLEIQKARDAQLLAIAQRGAQSQIAPLEEVVKSPDSAKMVSANPQLQQVWRQVAPGLGMDPVKDFNDNNVRVAFTMAGNQIRTQSQMPTQAPPVALRTIRLPDGRTAQVNPMDNKQTIDAASDLQQVIGPDGKPTLMPKGLAAGATPYNAQTFVNPAAASSIADLIAHYKMAPLSGMALKTAQGQETMAQVQAINPNYDSTSYQTKQQARTAFAKGKQGDTVRSLSVATDHLDQLTEAATALKNGGIPAANKVANFFSEQTGNSSVTNFNAMKEIVGDEVVKAVVGATGAAGDREAIKKSFSAANSPEQLLGVIQKYKGLMGGQLKGLRQQYSKSTGLDDFDEMVSPNAQAQLGGKGGTSPPMANNKGWALHTDKNGNQAYVSPDGKSYEEVK